MVLAGIRVKLALSVLLCMLYQIVQGFLIKTSRVSLLHAQVRNHEEPHVGKAAAPPAMEAARARKQSGASAQMFLATQREGRQPDLTCFTYIGVLCMAAAGGRAPKRGSPQYVDNCRDAQATVP